MTDFEIGQLYVFDSGIKFMIYKIIGIEEKTELKTKKIYNEVVYCDREGYMGTIEIESIDNGFPSIFEAPYMKRVNDSNKKTTIQKLFVQQKKWGTP